MRIEQLMWIEKYRPMSLDEFVGQEGVKQRLKLLLGKKEELPHLLFAGPPGSGKTTMALIVARQILGDLWRDYTLSLNASDERGIDMVRERVKTFARFSDRREGVPFRLVVLDEADEMCLDPDTRILVGRLDDLKEMSLRELQESFGNKQFDLPSFGPKGMRLENDKGRIVPSGRAELYAITFEDGRIISASADHPFFVVRTTELVKVKTRDLVPGEELADFSDKILRCYNCGRPFYRPNQFAGYIHHFCSTGCRNSYFGSLSTARTHIERREIGLKAAEALKVKGIYQSDEYRRKRAEIATRLIREGRIPDPRTWRKFTEGEGAWVGQRLSSEHKEAIGEGSSRFFAEHPEVRETIGRKVRVSLLDPSGPYQSLVRAGFFKKTSLRANEASLNSWKKKGFRSETEVRMAQLLGKWNIPFERERVIFTTSHGHKYPFAVDFVLKGKVALLVNGCWWHVCPTCGVTPQCEKQRKNMEKDYRHAAGLERLGYRVVVVWEHELKSEKSIQAYVLPRVFETVGIAGGAPPKVKHSKVKSVERAGPAEVLNISVTRNRNFLLANGILTHNTSDAQTALRRIMEETSTFTRFILICVAPWTKVLLPEEVETTISKLKGKAEASVTSLDLGTTTLKDDRVVNFVESSPRLIGKRCLHIQTNTGRELELTEDHLIWTPNGWAPAGTLKVGEKIAVFPHLEGTEREDHGIILDTKLLSDSIEAYETTRLNRKRFGEARRLTSLTSKAKQQVVDEVTQLYKKFVSTDGGLTSRELDIIRFMECHPIASRREIQRSLGLSRAWTDQLLRTLEKKGHLIRASPSRHSHEQFFQRTDSEISTVRNLADVKRLLRKLYSLEVSYTTIRNIVSGSHLSGRMLRVTEGLSKRKLLPLDYGGESVGALARVTGFLFGDGCLSSNGKRLIFTGNWETLSEVQKDIHRLGFKSSEIKRRFIQGEIRGRKIEGTTTFFYTDSVELWSLFHALGVPIGDKSDQPCEVPKWIQRGTRFAKREFLRGFFDCESCTPKIKRCNFEALWLTQNRTKRHLDAGRLFMQQTINLLEEFGVKAVPLRITPDGTRRDGMPTYKIKLTLRASNLNMRRFFSQICFFYERRKRLLGRLAHEYLRYKAQMLARRGTLAQRVLVELDNKGRTITEIAQDKEFSTDFIRTIRLGKKVKISRTGLLPFVEWAKEYSIGGTEMVWNLVEKIEDIELNSVMDITTKSFHTFISNGVLSHNCNYSSGIIEPLQSRCAIFRFQRYDEAAVVTHLKEIAKKEKVKASSDSVFAEVFEATQGDLRQAINLMQAAAVSGTLTIESVKSVTGAAVKTRVADILKLALDGDFEGARAKMVELTRVYGVPERDFLKYANEALNSSKPDDIGKAISIMAEYDFRLVQGAQPELQLTAMLAELSALKRK